MKRVLANGYELPMLGFGVYRLSDEEMMERAIIAAIQAGYRLFDTAQMYQNEALLGKALKTANVHRDAIVLTTKVAPANMKSDCLRASVMESLQKLQSDYIDLLLIHWPGQDKTRLLACWNELIAFYKEGKAKAIGVSNAMIKHLEWLQEAEIQPMVNQIEVNIHNNQQNVCDYCQTHGIVVQAWSPLARASFEDPVVEELAKKYQCTPAQLVLNWEMQKGVCVIPKSSHPSRIKENARTGIVLTRQDMTLLNSLNRYKDMSYNPYTYDY